MFKSFSYAALTLLATLTATQAAIRSAAPHLIHSEAMHEVVDLVKPRTPPRKPLGPTKHEKEEDRQTLQNASRSDNRKAGRVFVTGGANA